MAMATDGRNSLEQVHGEGLAGLGVGDGEVDDVLRLREALEEVRRVPIGDVGDGASQRLQRPADEVGAGRAVGLRRAGAGDVEARADERAARRVEDAAGRAVCSSPPPGAAAGASCPACRSAG